MIILNKMIYILTGEAIFNTGLISLFTAIKQHYTLNATSFYFEPFRNQLNREMRHYFLLTT